MLSRNRRIWRTQVRVAARIGDDVSDPYERNSAGEDSGAAADLCAPVSDRIPVEAESRRENRFGVGQLALVDNLRLSVLVQRSTRPREGIVDRVGEVQDRKSTRLNSSHS